MEQCTEDYMEDLRKWLNEMSVKYRTEIGIDKNKFKDIINAKEGKKEEEKKLKNEIKIENQKEEKDEVVDEFKESLKKHAINNNEITKIKPFISQEWINELA